MSDQPKFVHVSAWRRTIGWAVHAYTGLGLILTAWITAILLQSDRTVDDYRFCFLLMYLGAVIDATDGTLARLVRINEAVPAIDGRRLDDLVRFLMSAALPLLLIDQAGLLPIVYRWVLLVALVASAYGFSRRGPKTADRQFRGFPSCWNVVAFYLYALPVTGQPAALVVLGLSVLTFVPSRYPYPTRPGLMNRLMLVLSIPWAVLVGACVVRHWRYAPGPPGMIALSAGYPTLYLLAAWGTSFWRWSNGGTKQSPGPYGPGLS